MKLIFATRPSALARWQTQWVIAALQKIHPDLDCEEKVITTQGDKILDKPLPEIGGKGLIHTGTRKRIAFWRSPLCGSFAQRFAS